MTRNAYRIMGRFLYFYPDLKWYDRSAYWSTGYHMEIPTENLRE